MSIPKAKEIFVFDSHRLLTDYRQQSMSSQLITHQLLIGVIDHLFLLRLVSYKGLFNRLC